MTSTSQPVERLSEAAKTDVVRPGERACRPDAGPV
jgi:hypothetical protein